MISRWKKKPKKPGFSRALSLKLPIIEPKVENFSHQILKISVFAAESIIKNKPLGGPLSRGFYFFLID